MVRIREKWATWTILAHENDSVAGKTQFAGHFCWESKRKAGDSCWESAIEWQFCIGLALASGQFGLDFR